MSNRAADPAAAMEEEQHASECLADDLALEVQVRTEVGGRVHGDKLPSIVPKLVESRHLTGIALLRSVWKSDR